VLAGIDLNQKEKLAQLSEKSCGAFDLHQSIAGALQL
jgi:hypothetical protein